MSEKPVFLCDMDGTIADFHASLERRMRSMASPPELGIDWDAMIFADHENSAPDWVHERTRLITGSPGFWRDLLPISDGLRILRLAESIGFAPHILTQGPRSNPAAWSEKLQWLANHDLDIPVTVTRDKGLVYGRVLFDDFPEYVLRWVKHRPRGLVLMLDQPWNREFTHPNVVRVPRGLESMQGAALLEPVREALIAARDR